MTQPDDNASSQAVRLAQEALTASQQLQACLAAENLPQPSFEANGPIHVVSKSSSEDAQLARTVVMDTALKLFTLVSGPGDLLPNMAASVCNPRCYVATTEGLPIDVSFRIA